MTRLAGLAPSAAMLASLGAFATEPSASGGSARLDLGQNLSALPVDKILQMGGALGLVLVLIAALAWIVRRYGRAGRSGQGELALLGGLALGGRERLMLVRAGNDRVLIGVAPGQIRALHVLSEPRGAGSPEVAASDRFEKTLNGMLASEHR